MSVLSIRLDDDLKKRLDLEAERSGRRRSSIIRELLNRSLPSPDEASEARQRLERTRHLFGPVRTGISDLGANHEEHLRRLFDRRRHEVVRDADAADEGREAGDGAVLEAEFDRELEHRLEAVCAGSGLSRREALRRILAETLPPAPQPVGRERYELVRDLIGSVRSGVDDLGTEHEKYLWEMFDEQSADGAGHGADHRDHRRDG